MAQYTTSDKINKNRNIVDSKITMIAKEILHPLLIKLSSSKISYNILPVNELEVVSGHPIIFAFNHYRCQDTPIACNLIDRRAYILAGKQKLTAIDEMFFNLNGVIFVDRKDKIDMQESKKPMCDYLKNGNSLIYFPEGTWNTDASLLMLPMKWGIIDVARESNAQIIPIILHYDEEKNNCYVRYEKPIICNNNDKLSEINKLRDIMATAKWKFIELTSLFQTDLVNDEMIINYSKYLFSDDVDVEKLYSLLNLNIRKDINIEEMKNNFLNVLKEYPELDFEYEQSTIYKPYVSKEEVFEPIKRLNLKR